MIRFYQRILALFALFVLVGLSLSYWLLETQKLEARALTTEALSIYRAELEQELAQNLALTGSIKTYVSIHPNLNQEEFSVFASDLLSQKNHIRNIGAAKNFVINLMYPLEGNEGAIGLNYRTIPNQMQAVQEAVDARAIVLAGPLKLVQGGQAIIARQPVFNKADGSLWGIVSVVINSDMLFESVAPAAESLDYAIRGKDAKGAQGDIVYGDITLFSNLKAELADISLPYGSWQIAGKLKSPPSYALLHWIAFAVLFFLFFIVVWFLKKSEDYEHKLLQEKENAEQASKAKSSFLAHMSHEIRTPMNGVIGVIQLLMQEKLNREQIELVQTAQYSAENLLNVINDILDFSKIEANQLHIEEVPFSLSMVLGYVEKNLSVQSKAKELAFEVSKLDGIPDMWVGDSTRLGQVLMNLLSNAIKFTYKGYVSLIVEYEKEVSGNLVFTVRDSGIGMSDVELRKIFQSFSQADSSINRRFGGTGLGLVITKSIVEMMGGTITVMSEKDIGSTFQVSLPLRPVDENIAIEIKEKEEQKSKYKNSFSGSTILLAEDVDINAMLFTSMLKESDATVIRAKNGEEAIELFDKHNPSLVFMDIQMPVMDGIAATAAIRKISPSVPIIALTANVISNDIDHYYREGFTDVLSKPMKMDELYNALQKYRV